MEDDVLIEEIKVEWYHGYGGGIWIAPLGQAVISFDYSISNDYEEGVIVRLGFFF